MLGADRLSGFLVHHLLPQTVAGSHIDLMEVRPAGLRDGRKELDRTGHERETQVPFPKGAWHEEVRFDHIGRPGDWKPGEPPRASNSRRRSRVPFLGCERGPCFGWALTCGCGHVCVSPLPSDCGEFPRTGLRFDGRRA